MCGIAGVVEPSPDRRAVEAMIARLEHRGPDGCRVAFPDERVALAHRRLAIIDLTDAASQPMVGPSGSIIVYNGEIYNYVELRAELEALGARFTTASDTEVLLAAYERWGPECLSRLNGMFAFVIHDPQRRQLFAARDRFGEKPLYYHHRVSDGRFVFASEIKALFAHPSVPCRPHDRAVYRFLRYKQVDPDPETFFEGIASLPAAHALTLGLDDGRLRSWRYWEVTDAPPERRPERELVDEFGALLGDSIRIRLRSDVAVGSSLSGGIDSSAIVGYLSRICGVADQHTFSARFPGFHLDEGRYIDDVVELAGATAHEIVPAPTPQEVERTVWHQDMPFGSLSIFAQWTVMELARRHGVTVLLDGQGADETLAGYHLYFAARFRELFAAGRWLELAREVRAYRAANGLGRLRALGPYAAPAWLARQVRQRRAGTGIAPDYALTHGSLPEPVPSQLRGALNRALHTSLARGMLPGLLRYADRNSMAFGREVRLPYLDHRLVELAFRLPAELKLRRAVTKRVLREAMGGVLPPSVRDRRDKIGYAPPQAEWLRGPLRDWAGDLLASPRLAERPWADAAAVRAAWSSFLAGEDRLEADVWRWISLEAWARAYLDRGHRDG